MKRMLLIVAILFGMTLAAASPAQAWGRRGYYGRPIVARYYTPYFYGPYGPPAYGYFGGFPGSPAYGGYPGFPAGGVGIVFPH